MTWQAWNDGAGKRKWFLARVIDGLTEYHWSKPDPHGQQHVIRYARYETAFQAAARLDANVTTPVSNPPFEARCPGGCHQGGFADFDHYCDSAGIKPGEEPVAFAAWLNAISGWDGEMKKVEET